MSVGISRATPDDLPWIQDLLETRWASVTIVSRGRSHRADHSPAFIARVEGKRLGLVTYRIEDEECEMLTLDSLRWNEGVGTSLIEAVAAEARALGCKRLWLITSNDRLDSIAYYQRHGFGLRAVHPDSIKELRKLKPQIPEMGKHRIPIRDEVELDMEL